MSSIDIASLRNAAVNPDPFEHVVVRGFLRARALDDLDRDFPAIARPGSFPASALEFGPAFASLLDELQSKEMAETVTYKFGIDLSDKPTMITVRGRCRPSDGKIHRDSRNKLVTVLIYVNSRWDAGGGRLRLLRGAADIDDYAVEVLPDAGTLLAFRCTENAWHGHEPYDGERRSIQLNWVASDAYRRRELARHRFSAFFKRH